MSKRVRNPVAIVAVATLSLLYVGGRMTGSSHAWLVGLWIFMAASSMYGGVATFRLTHRVALTAAAALGALGSLCMAGAYAIPPQRPERMPLVLAGAALFATTLILRIHVLARPIR
jgi:hypothetical protein